MSIAPFCGREHMTHVTAEQVEAGQAVYTRKNLRLYDLIVLGISNRFLWRCPTRRILRHYNEHVSANHLDVGVGTGYFLDRCRFPSATPRVALLDLNENSLEFTARRIARYRPERYQGNVLEPISLNCDKFDSIAVNYVLHCLPGTIGTKAVALDHLKAWLNPGGVLFGSTLLTGGVKRSRMARKLMEAYNKQGIFSNTSDTLEELEAALRQRFDDVEIEVVGCAALFAGRA